MDSITIRRATLDDAKDILDIYEYYINKTAITYEKTVPSLESFRERMEKILLKYPYLVLTINNKIVAYSYASTFKDREAYDWACELSIYVHNLYKGKGYGSRLYNALEACLKEMGITNVYACIAVPDKEDEFLDFHSEKFHEKMGYKRVGFFYKCAFKFYRWYNMIWMEKILSNHHPNQVSPKSFKDINDNFITNL